MTHVSVSTALSHLEDCGSGALHFSTIVPRLSSAMSMTSERSNVSATHRRRRAISSSCDAADTEPFTTLDGCGSTGKVCAAVVPQEIAASAANIRVLSASMLQMYI